MITCIIQARMGSSRLPGKVLKPVAGKSILEHVISRLSLSSFVDQFIVATTTQPEDDAIQEFCEDLGIDCFRGSDWDVLDRFYHAAQQHEVSGNDTVVRICCDNPLHSHEVLDFCIAEYEKRGVDYFSNSNHEPDYLEDGFDVEVFSFRALEHAWKNARLLSEREHVTPFIKNSGSFRCEWKKADDEYNYKLSVDTLQDLQVVETIFNELEDQPGFGIHDVVKLLKNKPGILEINKDSVINSGYKKSLEEDREASTDPKREKK